MNKEQIIELFFFDLIELQIGIYEKKNIIYSLGAKSSMNIMSQNSFHILKFTFDKLVRVKNKRGKMYKKKQKKKEYCNLNFYKYMLVGIQFIFMQNSNKDKNYLSYLNYFRQNGNYGYVKKSKQILKRKSDIFNLQT